MPLVKENKSDLRIYIARHINYDSPDGPTHATIIIRHKGDARSGNARFIKISWDASKQSYELRLASSHFGKGK